VHLPSNATVCSLISQKQGKALLVRAYACAHAETWREEAGSRLSPSQWGLAHIGCIFVDKTICLDVETHSFDCFIGLRAVVLRPGGAVSQYTRNGFNLIR
jgi:hypothetical protein